MKTIALLLALVFIEKPTTIIEKEKPVLEGSWELKKYKYGDDQVFSEVPAFIQYVKNITPSHFSWCSYNPEDGKVIGMGGGTYHYDMVKYVEKTDFWFPSGAGIAGTSTSFNYTIKGSQWIINGYIKSMTLDPSTGEFASIDSTYMVEIWQKLD